MALDQTSKKNFAPIRSLDHTARPMFSSTPSFSRRLVFLSGGPSRVPHPGDADAKLLAPALHLGASIFLLLPREPPQLFVSAARHAASTIYSARE
jgi:hypothetical protein